MFIENRHEKFLRHVLTQIFKVTQKCIIQATTELKCPRSLVTMTNFVMVFINSGMSYISIRLLNFITYVHCVSHLSIFGDGQLLVKPRLVLQRCHDLFSAMSFMEIGKRDNEKLNFVKCRARNHDKLTIQRFQKGFYIRQ